MGKIMKPIPKMALALLSLLNSAAKVRNLLWYILLIMAIIIP